MSIQNKGTISWENLAHFSCQVCGKWWSVGDCPKDKLDWHCPWCGHKQTFNKEF